MIKELIEELLLLKEKNYLKTVSIVTENLYLDVNKALEVGLLDEIIKYETVKSLKIKLTARTIVEGKTDKLHHLIKSKYKDVIVSVETITEFPERLTIRLTK